MVLLSYLEHFHSPRTSDVLNIYLFFSAIFDATQVRTIWLLSGQTKIAVVASICLGLKLSCLALEVLAKDDILLDKYRSLGPERLSGIFNRRLFWWLNPLFIRGYKSILDQHDMFQLDPALQSEALGRRLQSEWSSNNSKLGRKHFLESFFHKHKLFWITIRTLCGPLLAAVPPRIGLIGLTYAQPFLIHAIVDSVGHEKRTIKGYGLIAATALIYISIAILTGYHQHKTFRFITMVRGSLVAVIYNKTTALTTVSTPDRAPVTLMSTDVDAIVATLQMMHEVWAAPIEVIIGIWLLERQVGVVCVATVGIALRRWP